MRFLKPMTASILSNGRAYPAFGGGAPALALASGAAVLAASLAGWALARLLYRSDAADRA